MSVPEAQYLVNPMRLAAWGIISQLTMRAEGTPQHPIIMSYTNLLYHIVIRTKDNHRTITETFATELYKYIWGLVQNKQSQLLRVNSMPDHVHIFIALHPTISIAEFVKTIKVSTHHFMKEHPDMFPYFEGWSKSYCALTYSERDKDMIIGYIKKQQEHHKTMDFAAELKMLLEENNVKYNPEYFLKE